MQAAKAHAKVKMDDVIFHGHQSLIHWTIYVVAYSLLNDELIGQILNSGTYSLLNQELIDQILNSGTYSLLNQELNSGTYSLLNQELIGQILKSGQQIMT